MVWSLRSRGLSEHLTNTTITATYTAIGDVNNVTPQMRWTNDENIAMQVIAASIPNTVFTNIKSKTNTKDVWDALKALYEGRTTMVLVNLGQQLQSMRCADEDNVREHFDKLANMREQLAAMGKSIPDDEYASTLMGSLPPSYASMLQAITASAEISGTAVTPIIVIKLATDEYDRRSIQSNKTQDEAFATESQKKKGFKGKRRNVECENCHKTGHTKAECWAKGGGNEGGAPWRKNKKAGDKDKKSGDKTSSATAEEQTPDLEVWAAIDEIEEDDATPPITVMTAENPIKGQNELYDTGASRHMSPLRKQFTNYREIKARSVVTANDGTFHAIGMGDLEIDVYNGTKSTRVLLKDTLYAPELSTTIVSIGRILKAGYKLGFDEDSFIIRKKDGSSVIGRIPMSTNALFKAEHVSVADSPISEESVDILTLHRRLGHASIDIIRTLVRTGSITGVRTIDNKLSYVCDSCEYAKTTRKPIRKERVAEQAQNFGDEVHTDVWGPSPTASLGGRRYYVTFTDDHSRYTRLEVLRTKDEAFEAYKSFAAWAKTQHGATIKRLRSDRGGEFTSNDFTAYLRQQGTERRLTTADTPQHNGVAESLNRRLMERVRAMMHQANLPKNLWAEAIHHAVWLKNRTSMKVLGNQTPCKRLYKTKPNFAGVPEWGQEIWVYNPVGTKLDARAKQARWVGYDANSTHAHRVYWAGKNSVSVERNVKFISPSVVINTHSPSFTPIPSALQNIPPPPPQPPTTPAPTPTFHQRPRTPQQPRAPPSTPNVAPLPLDEDDEDEDQTITPRRVSVPSTSANSQPRRSGRTAQVPGYYRQLAGEDKEEVEQTDHVFMAGFDEIIAEAIEETSTDPKSLAEAQSRADWPRWKEAMDKEMSTLEKAGTWKTVPRPTDKNIVGSKWVFRIKRKADGTVDKYKARLVARGFSQIYGVDFFNTYSPVARLSSFRLILAIAARYDWEVESFDFVGAYLNGELDDNEEIYMDSPPGYSNDADTVKRLLKALYGLKQAGRKWYIVLVRTLDGLDFKITYADPGVFFVHVGEHVLILAVHVDDCMFTGSSIKLIMLYKEKLNACYALTDLGPIHWLLGIKITRDRAARTISLSQSSFIDSILSRFSFSDIKPYGCPMIPGSTYSKSDSPSSPEEAVRMKRTPYRQAIGSLMYVAVATRPDITFAVSILSRFLNNPGDKHWDAVKRIFRYLQNTKSFQLTFGGERHELEGYSDADGGTQED